MVKKNKIIIIGFLKCGQESTMKYYQKLGYDVIKDEIITRPDARKVFDESNYTDRQIVICTRDPVERCWSQYKYLKPNMSYEEYLVHKEYHSGWGEVNPIYHSNYLRHITAFLDLKPIIRNIDKEDNDFPKANIGGDDKMTSLQYELTAKLLENEHTSPMEPSK